MAMTVHDFEQCFWDFSKYAFSAKLIFHVLHSSALLICVVFSCDAYHCFTDPCVIFM